MPTEVDRLYTEHHAMVFAVAYRVTGSSQDAEDVLHTVFLRLLKREGATAAMSNSEAYLRRSAVNAALDVVRGRKVTSGLQPEQLVSTSRDALDQLGDAQLRDQLRVALAKLPDRAAEVFVLRYIEDRPNREIARLLGMSQLAVAGALFRAKQKLKHALSKDGVRKAGMRP
jgi:RNA polymerase sigma-70 factor (ECF subfamily)